MKAPHSLKPYRGIVISVAFAAFMAKLDTYIVNISLPTIANAFQIGTGTSSYIILAYIIAVTSTMLLFGKLGDRVGLKRIFVSGYGGFVLGSLLCGVSPSIEWMVGARLLQGLGGAMMISTAYALIARFLPKNLSGAALGIVTTAAALGVSVGAPLGGFITHYLSWRWIFLVNVPVGTAAIYTAWRVLPSPSREKPDPTNTVSRFDVQGALMTFLTLTLLVLFLSLGREKGWTSPFILGCLAGSIFFLYRLVRWENRHPDPLLDINLLKKPDFLFAVLAGFFCFLFMAGNAFLQPFYLEWVRHLNTAQAGLLLSLTAITCTVMAPAAGRISDRINPAVMCSIGMTIAAFACLIFTLTVDRPGIWVPIVYMILAGIGLGLFLSPNTNLVMSLAPPGKQGLASGTFQTLTSVSLALGVCLFETIFSDHLPKGADLRGGDVPLSQMLSGFRSAYTFGVLVCLGAFFFAAAQWRRARQTTSPPPSAPHPSLPG